MVPAWLPPLLVETFIFLLKQLEGNPFPVLNVKAYRLVIVVVFGVSLQSNRTEFSYQPKGYAKASDISAATKFGINLHLFFTVGWQRFSFFSKHSSTYILQAVNVAPRLCRRRG